ncbi:MAG: MBL fold metallo-hydrolase [Anaerolineae bacterium]|nr:MBL fold metallo-hydrolase [Anaerolineae bacterium]
MELIFLGTGDEHGVPRIGCECAVCHNALSPGSRNCRTGPSAALRYGPSYAQRLVLLDAPPELRYQVTNQHLGPFDALLLTHTHDAHSLGIGPLLAAQREAGRPLPIHAPSQVLDDARERFAYLWNDKTYRRILQPEPLESTADLWGLAVQPLRVDHGLGGTAYGYVLSYNSVRLGYVTDMLRATTEARRILDSLDVLVLGASHYYEGIEMWKRSVMDVMAAVELIRDLSPGCAYLTHLSHTVDYGEVVDRLPASTNLAYDGLVVEVPT